MEFCTLENSTDIGDKVSKVYASFSVVVAVLLSHARFLLFTVSSLLRNPGAEWVGLTQHHSCFMAVILSQILKFGRMVHSLVLASQETKHTEFETILGNIPRSHLKQNKNLSFDLMEKYGYF